MKQQGTVVSIQGRGGRQSPRGLAPGTGESERIDAGVEPYPERLEPLLRGLALGEFAGFIAAAATAILVALLTIFLIGLGARDALHWLLGPKW